MTACPLHPDARIINGDCLTCETLAYTGIDESVSLGAWAQGQSDKYEEENPEWKP